MTRRFQFRLSSGLIVVTCACILLAYATIERLNRFLPHEIPTSFRHAEVDGYFTRFRTGQVLHERTLRLLGADIVVDVVATVRGAEYGFVPVSGQLDEFWIRRPGLSIKRYDEHHLFVTFSDWFAADLERGVPGHAIAEPNRTRGSGTGWRLRNIGQTDDEMD